MRQPARYYLFPRDAYFIPSVGRLIELLEVMDREMELGLHDGGSFRGFLRTRPRDGAVEDAAREDPSHRVLDVSSFDDFRAGSNEMSGEPKEIQIQLGRPGREPFPSEDRETRHVEVVGFTSLRMIDLVDLEPAHLWCPSCGRHSLVDSSFSVRPDPRHYCSRCGGLTPLPDTRLAITEADEGIPFPCYRFAILLDTEAEGDIGPSVSAMVPTLVGIGALEGSLGCGLRAVLVRSPARAKP